MPGPLGDTLDLSDLLTGYTAGVSDANDFVQFVPGGGDTDRHGGCGRHGSAALSLSRSPY